jgi:hypothetical protein
MARKKSQKRVDESLIIDDGKWDDVDDFGFDVSGIDTAGQRINGQARRLYDHYQEERRLRELLGDDFDF